MPPTLLIASIRRGGILLGALDDRGGLDGFVYSMPAQKDGRLTQWSHMLGVRPSSRAAGVGAALKLAQRRAALDQGVDLVEWTYDPLQALNAHFNFSKLGVVVQEYEENAYGASPSPLHAGAPTDRFVAEWHIRRPHVERRISSWGQPTFRDRSVADAEAVNASLAHQQWRAPGPANLNAGARRLLVEIPAGFTGMLAADAPLALAWRMQTRQLFQAYLPRGYRVVDFFLSRAAGRGQYLLVNDTP